MVWRWWIESFSLVILLAFERQTIKLIIRRFSEKYINKYLLKQYVDSILAYGTMELQIEFALNYIKTHILLEYLLLWKRANTDMKPNCFISWLWTAPINLASHFWKHDIRLNGPWCDPENILFPLSFTLSYSYHITQNGLLPLYCFFGHYKTSCSELTGSIFCIW